MTLTKAHHSRTGLTLALCLLVVSVAVIVPCAAAQLPPPPPLPASASAPASAPPQAAPGVPPADATAVTQSGSAQAAPGMQPTDPTAVTQSGATQGLAPQLPSIDPTQQQTQGGPGVPGKIDQVVFVGYDLNPTQQKGLNDLSQAAQAAGSQSTALFADANNPDQLMNAMQSAVGLASNTIAPSGGGGGGMVLPAMDSNTPIVIAAALLGGCGVLLIGIVMVRRRPAGAPAASPASGPRVSAGLTVTSANGLRSVVRITGERTTLGRAADNVVVIDDGEVSGRHAEIVVSPEGFRLRDVGSANGTLVNGQSVTDVYLALGDEIRVGVTTLTLTE